MKPPIKVALEYLKVVMAANAEKEVERFLKVFLPGSPYANKIKAVGGYVRDEFLSILKNDPTIEAKDLDLVVVNIERGAEKATHYIHDHFKDTKPCSISEPRQMGKGYPIWQITFKEDISYKGRDYATKGAVIEFADTVNYPRLKSWACA